MTFSVTTFDCMTAKELGLYDGMKNPRTGKERQQSARNELIEVVKTHSGFREIELGRLYENEEPRINRVIARFEDECVRQSTIFDDSGEDTLGVERTKNIPLFKEMIILTSDNAEYHNIILNQIVNNGLKIGDDKYVFYASSANQQKNREVCLLEEKFLNKNIGRFMCGLSELWINEQGGCNTGKYLAYRSLIFSKSVKLPNEINIDNVLVLPEFETIVEDKVNFIDMEKLEIEEGVIKSVPVNHMDGAGIFLPGVLPQSCQIRGGWIKGAVFPFDFVQFISEMQKNGRIGNDAVVKDAWGKSYSIEYVKNNIKVILNASQLKMWKYYSDWDSYKSEFKSNGLEICINNMLHYPTAQKPIVHSAYQFYQTIPRGNVTDEKIKELTKKTIDIINKAKNDKDVALELMGVDLKDETKELTPFYAAIKKYPPLLSSKYAQDRIKKKLESIRHKAMSGKPFIDGYYNYICPDLYAACEHWFCGDDKPQGLVPKNHVYNELYAMNEDVEKVCYLRSPHLSDCEHAIRKLVTSEECKRWFSGMDTVISVHDLLVYTLTCDNDGDEGLITPDKAFIDMLDTNEKYPLYYVMKKGEAKVINNETIYKCLMDSFKNSGIGEISNTLTKYLNIVETDEMDLDFVRIITAYNNYLIDFPKSQYLPELGKYKEMFEEWNDREYPLFFKWAKNKETDKCCADKMINALSNVNRISKQIRSGTRNKTESTNDTGDKKEEFNPNMLKSKDCPVKRKSQMYEELKNEIIKLKKYGSRKAWNGLSTVAKNKNQVNLEYDLFYFYCDKIFQKIFKKENKSATVKIKKGENKKISVREQIASYLVDIEYYQEEMIDTNKDILWNCYGDILYQNLCHNLEPGKEIPVKKIAYRKRTERDEIIEKSAEVVHKIVNSEPLINITQSELDWVMNLECRKGCETDRYLLFCLLVLHKRKKKYLEELRSENEEKITEDNKKHFRIYKNVKGEEKVTRATLNKWIGKDIADKGITRLEKSEIIKVESCNDYDKIYISSPKEIQKDEKSVLEVKSGNPLLYYYQHTGEAKVAECEICKKLFRVIGNAKTCGPACSRKLSLKK